MNTMPTKQQLDIQSTLRSAITRPLANAKLTTQAHGKFAGRTRDTETFRLRADRIRPDAEQVRQIEKEAADPEVIALAESIKQVGLIHYPEVRYIEKDDIYELVAGERRFTAMTKILQWEEIPVRVVEIDDRKKVWLQLHENVHRKNLHPLEIAASVSKAMHEQGLSIDQAAVQLKKSKSFVQKALTIADKLSAKAKKQILESSHKAGLDTIYLIATTPEDKQIKIVEQLVDDGLNHRQIVSLTTEAKKGAKPSAEERGRGGRKAKTRAYSKTIKTKTGGSVTVKFRKSRVTTDELVETLTDALEHIRSQGQSKAA